MPYKPITRVITVEFRPGSVPNEFDIVVTPDLAVVRYGDKIEWRVQGLPPAQKKLVTIGPPQLIDAPARAVLSGDELVAATPAPVPAMPAGKGKKGKKAAAVRLVLALGTAEPGYYKYDIKYGATTLVDPDMEIRGPRT